MAGAAPPADNGDSDDDGDSDERFMRLALAQAELAVAAGEVPVGCVFVRGGEVIGSGFNATNAEYDATRHAELVAADQVLYTPLSRLAPASLLPVGVAGVPTGAGGSDYGSCGGSGASASGGGGVFGSCDLFVTCEPCLMCAAALGRLGVRRVVFGCHNDRFGGCGSILSLHEGAYPVRAGVLKDEAVAMFRRFYSRENSRAPEAKRKRKDGTRATGDGGGVVPRQEPAGGGSRALTEAAPADGADVGI
jgi:tRNA-specific adenosine deaminase 2